MPLRNLVLTLGLLTVGSGLLYGQSLTITNTPPSGVVGTPYMFLFKATGGSGNYQWTWGPDMDRNGVELPPGLTMSSSGQITGTPTQAGGYAVIVEVSDSQAELFGNASLTITIAPCSPTVISPLTLPANDVGVNYDFQIKVQGCQTPYTFTGPQGFPIPNATFPTGMSIDSATGIITGTPGPATNGNYSIPITIKEAAGGYVQPQFALTINAPPMLTNSSLPNGIVGAAYGPVTLTASGGTYLPGAVPMFRESGLPPGLTLDTSGILAGTPTKAGSYTPTLGVTDSVNGLGQQMFNVSITTANAQLQVSPSSLAFNANAIGSTPPPQAVSIVPAPSALPPYNFTIMRDGGQANTPVPAWLSVVPAANGVAPSQLVVKVDQGTMAAGKYPGRIRIIDSNGLENDVAVTLTVSTSAQKLQVTPNILHFSALQQSPGTLTAGLLVSNGGGSGSLGFTTSVLGGSSWISSVTPNSGQTTSSSPVLLQVTVNTGGLETGSYRDVIEVSSTAGKVDVPVVLFIAEGGAVLGVNLTGYRLQAVQGGGFSNAQTLQILNLGDSTSTVNWSASLVSPVSWLSLLTTSGTATPTTPGSLAFTLTANATQMAPGGYYALLKIVDSNSRNSPQYVLVVLDLASSGSPPLPDPTPGGLFFVATAGGSKTSAEVVTINTSSASGVPFQVSASTTDGGTWLILDTTAGVSSGSQAGTVNVSVDPTGLTPGVYVGYVNVSISGVLRSVNVTMVVLPAGASSGAASIRRARPAAVGCSASRVVLTETGLVNNFAVPAGWPATLIVQLNDDCGGSLGSGSVVASFSNGDAPLSLVSNGQDGTYSATWQPGSVTSQMVVTLNGASGTLQAARVQLNGGVAQNQNQPPTLTPGGTLHNLNPVVGAPLAPGTIAQVYGTGLGPPKGVSPGVIPLVNTFDNTYVLVGPYQAPLYYLSSGQLNVQLPAELSATQQYPIVVSANNAITLPDTVSIVPATPGVAAGANGAMIAQHTDYSLVTANHPAKPGDVIIMYLAGLGATNPSVPSGQPAPSKAPLAEVTMPVTVTVDGQNAKVDFAGLTPGSAGLYQIDFQVPTNAKSGSLKVVVMQNGLSSNTTTLPVSK